MLRILQIPLNMWLITQGRFESSYNSLRVFWQCWINYWCLKPSATRWNCTRRYFDYSIRITATLGRRTSVISVCQCFYSPPISILATNQLTDLDFRLLSKYADVKISETVITPCFCESEKRWRMLKRIFWHERNTMCGNVHYEDLRMCTI